MLWFSAKLTWLLAFLPFLTKWLCSSFSFVSLARSTRRTWTKGPPRSARSTRSWWHWCKYTALSGTWEEGKEHFWYKGGHCIEEERCNAHLRGLEGADEFKNSFPKFSNRDTESWAGIPCKENGLFLLNQCICTEFLMALGEEIFICGI